MVKQLPPVDTDPDEWHDEHPELTDEEIAEGEKLRRQAKGNETGRDS